MLLRELDRNLEPPAVQRVVVLAIRADGSRVLGRERRWKVREAVARRVEDLQVLYAARCDRGWLGVVVAVRVSWVSLCAWYSCKARSSSGKTTSVSMVASATWVATRWTTLKVHNKLPTTDGASVVQFGP